MGEAVFAVCGLIYRRLCRFGGHAPIFSPENGGRRCLRAGRSHGFSLRRIPYPGRRFGWDAGRFANAVAERPWRQGGLLPQSRSRLPERGRKVFPCRAHWECGAALRRPAGRIRILNGRNFLFRARPGLLRGIPRKGRKVIRDFCGAARAALVSRCLPAAGRGSRSFPQAPEARPFQASPP